ncbi:MBL fold metallo-hydrolase [Seohaeicola sp. SP36]|jgi:glyoxylase-like metal-dependent hydrolase (beta-lactamase superfamily II)|uniref:MBL fold metallo-hydrolase n=1 Tax=unclassified Seohaeicola TaxID=2641111 RepID=UPI00237C0CE0|nr:MULTISPECIES: MBL fold metallo-hydrolase [unclassified Seohaeicola]MDD9709239.1 MBL fold metallo-hydrolase [Seohaeicola sp. 4SK31]MDD9737402.1 MBL fold metallo-hydrolase [Seohaeicola sp. SP36]
MKHLFWTLAAIFVPLSAVAEMLNVQVVEPGIWAIEGPATQRDPENLGNNATFGLIETDEGAVLVDPGGTWAGAVMLHEVVRDLTEQKVTHVINTGGQDHRWLGNGYWQDQGAIVIAANAAVEDQQARASMQLSMLSQLVGAGLDGTEPAFATVTFQSDHVLELGGRVIEIHHEGAAHTSGDSFVWLPQERVVFTGDIVYVGRTPGVMEFSDSAAWLDSFAAIEALDPEYVVPGHGPLTTLAQSQADTRDYLHNLRERIRVHIEDGGDIIGSVNVDQSAFAYLDQFEALAGRNAQAVFQQMEWE